MGWQLLQGVASRALRKGRCTVLWFYGSVQV